MNTLQTLKAWAEDLYNRTCLGETPYKKEQTIPIIVEHTHTQTILSVRERVERLKKSAEKMVPFQKIHYQDALTDLLKDLEAPNEEPVNELKEGYKKQALRIYQDTLARIEEQFKGDLEAPVEGDGV